MDVNETLKFVHSNANQCNACTIKQCLTFDLFQRILCILSVDSKHNHALLFIHTCCIFISAEAPSGGRSSSEEGNFFGIEHK